MSEDQI